MRRERKRACFALASQRRRGRMMLLIRPEYVQVHGDVAGDRCPDSRGGRL